jgi:dihydroneopterin aldolase
LVNQQKTNFIYVHFIIVISLPKFKINGSHKSAKTDNLRDTVDYVHLNKIVREEMAIRTKLLETVADKILIRILNEISVVKKAIVEVSKVNPPIGGNVAMVTIKMKKTRR